MTPAAFGRSSGVVYHTPEERYGYIQRGMLQLWKVQLLMNGRQRVGMEELIYSLEVIAHAPYSLGIPCMSCVYHAHALQYEQQIILCTIWIQFTL